MTRSARQSKILSLIGANAIDTQEELCNLLRNDGFVVTQATVSRDIKELGLIKVQTADGSYRYATKREVGVLPEGRLLNVFRDAVVSVVAAENLIVVKTVGDSAYPVSAALGQCNFSEVLGIVADRSTVLVVCPSARDADKVATKINGLM